MLRPVKLKRFDAGSGDGSAETREGNRKTVVPEDTVPPKSGVFRAISHSLGPLTPAPESMDIPLGEEGARSLLKRTPTSYLLNQSYGLWVYISLFLLTLLLARKLSVEDYGVYAIAATAFNTIAYIVAFGLEDATTTFVPRILAEHGQASAAFLLRRLLLMRLGILLFCTVLLLFSLPALIALCTAIPTPLTLNIASGLRNPDLQKHIAPIAFWVFANGLFSLLNAVYAAVMRMKVVFIVGSLGQLFLLVLGFVTLQLNWGVTGILWLQGGVTFVGTIAFAIWQAPLLFSRGTTYKQPLGPVLRLGFSAWFTNLVSGALLKQVSILLLVSYGATLAQQAYFSLSFQLADAANLLLVSGFGGVGVAALAAAFVGKNYNRLSQIWQTLIKIETLLSAPGLIFCLFNAQNIAVALYGPSFAPIGGPFSIFLAFNIVVRVMGMTIHQSTLYVVGRPRIVVMAQWVGLIAVIVFGVILVPRWGPAGALAADGIARLLICGLMLIFLWKDLPRKYPLGYSIRLVLAVSIAAIPVFLFHPTSKPMLAVFALLFVLLSVVMLMFIRPLTKNDLDMIHDIRPGIVPYFKYFARGS